MDEFAQTRAPDDLFDDDFTPVREPSTQSYFPQAPAQSSKPTSHGPRNQIPRPESSPAPEPISKESNENPSSTNEADPTQTPTSPATNTQTTTPRPPKTHQAVRGDRLATGGTPKPKLTEDELSERLAAAKLNNAKRTEAYRLAEADEASFQQREARAAQRRQDESKARRAMDMEREKNRLRKLEAGAKGGREWDEGKEAQTTGREKEHYRRGANGGISGGVGRGRGLRGGPREIFEPNVGGDGNAGDPDRINGRRGGGFESRGRGGHSRGGRGDRGRGFRGGSGGGSAAAEQEEGGRGRGGRGGSGGGRGGSTAPEVMKQQPPDPATDFPALPTPSTTIMKPSEPPDRVGESLKMIGGKKESWADQVEAKES